MKISRDYFLQPNVLMLAKDLIGKTLHTRIEGIKTAGIITETEAYEGIADKASHAYNGRRTARTQTMFKKGGIAYVYLCYGMHHLFNLVTNEEEIPHAILIRAIKPVEGLVHMQKRRGMQIPYKRIAAGPGMVAKAMGIDMQCNNLSISGSKIWITDEGSLFDRKHIQITARIGVEYAGEAAKWPYRFVVNHDHIC